MWWEQCRDGEGKHALWQRPPSAPFLLAGMVFNGKSEPEYVIHTHV